MNKKTRTEPFARRGSAVSGGRHERFRRGRHNLRHKEAASGWRANQRKFAKNVNAPEGIECINVLTLMQLYPKKQNGQEFIFSNQPAAARAEMSRANLTGSPRSVLTLAQMRIARAPFVHTEPTQNQPPDRRTLQTLKT